MKKPVLSDRAAGVLCHLSSLPGPQFCGDLGSESYQFIDFLAASGVGYWQMLPINPIGNGDSPYSSVSSFAGDPLFLSLERLVKHGLLSAKDVAALPASEGRKTNYRRARKVKQVFLEKAFTKFMGEKRDRSKEFEKFQRQQQFWLEPYCLFTAIAKKQKTRCWYRWPKAFQAFEIAKKSVDENILLDAAFEKFLQFEFSFQWADLRSHAVAKGVRLIGDLPIFVAYESADVWSQQKFFYCKANGEPQYVAGVPPDYFNPDGQLWGNALYRWDVLQKDGFRWWLERFKCLLEYFDLIRIDHFIGFHRYWEIPASASSAKTGRWRSAKGRELFSRARQKLGGLPFIAEDLGLVVEEVHQLRDDFDLPGMRVLQFGFGANGEEASYHLPHEYVKNCVAYTGTHDNNTCRGWFEEAQQSSAYDADRIQNYFFDTRKSQIHWQMIYEIFQSNANLAVVPLQDLLGLGAAARMNIPGTPSGNWTWRFDKAWLTPESSAALKKILRAVQRTHA